MPAYWLFAASIANVVVKVDTARAHQFAPHNGVITAADAQAIFARSPGSDKNAEAFRLARDALRQDATAVEALTVLGLQAQLDNDAARASRISSYSTRLSRRELRPKIWAIEDAVTRGDVEGALRQYDLALRTSFDAQALLFPTLTAALAEKQIRLRLLRMLATKPVWEESFINYASASDIDPDAVLRLFVEGGRAGLVVPADRRADLINALFRSGEVEKAWAAYTQLRSGSGRDRSRDPDFSQTTIRRTIFDWQPGEDPILAAAILKSENGAGLLDFAVPPGAGGVLVSQTQLLAPGRYSIEGRSAGIDQPAASEPYWVLKCGDGREAGRVRLPSSAQKNGYFRGHFSVPQNCPVQNLSLVAVSSEDIAGVSGQIIRAQLAPGD